MSRDSKTERGLDRLYKYSVPYSLLSNAHLELDFSLVIWRHVNIKKL